MTPSITSTVCIGALAGLVLLMLAVPAQAVLIKHNGTTMAFDNFEPPEVVGEQASQWNTPDD